MRDPRLLDESAVADANWRDKGAQQLSSVPEADRVEANRVLVAWWSEVLSQDAVNGQERIEHVERLRSRCSNLSAQPQKLTLTAASTLDRDKGEVARNIGARLLGDSAATVVRGTTTAVELDRAVRFLTDCWEAVDALQDALLQPPAWPPSTETLAVTSMPVEDLLGHQSRHVPSTLVEEERKARERGVSAYFWGHYRELLLSETSLVRLILVARRDWGDIAIQADALPLRALRDWLWLALDLDADRESILALLRAAPPVFGKDGWTGSTSALVALRASVRHAKRLHDRLSQATRAYQPAPDAQAKLKQLEQNELPAWLRNVAEVAIARSDGRDVLILFASTLVRDDLTPAWSGQPAWPASRCALDAIYRALVTKPTLAECQQVARIGGVPWNRTSIDLATYLTTAAVFDADPNRVWAWYRELLLKNDDDLCWQAKNCDRRAVCYFALAERLGRVPNPYAEWSAIWKALFVTDRERARFATLDPNAKRPSLHLLRVGVELLRQTPGFSGAWRFFEELLKNMHTLLEDYPRPVNPIKYEIALEMLDVAVRIPGGDWRKVVETYRSLLCSASNRVYVAAILLDAGASFGEVESTVEVSPCRLLDSVAELRRDFSAPISCDLVAAAAERYGRDQGERPFVQ